MSFTTINAKTSLPDIFASVKEAKTTNEKLDILKKHYSVSTAAVISLIFNPAISISIPAGVPEGFEFNESGSLSLERAIRSFPSFVNVEGNDRLQIGWLRLMRSLDRKDAEFAFALKDRTIDVGLTQEEVHKAFPTLIPAPVTGVKAPYENPKVAPKKSPEVDVVVPVIGDKISEDEAAAIAAIEEQLGSVVIASADALVETDDGLVNEVVTPVPAVVADEFPDADEVMGASTVVSEGTTVPSPTATVKQNKAAKTPKVTKAKA